MPSRDRASVVLHRDAAEALDDGSGKSLGVEPDRLERQVIILRWFLSRDEECLPGAHVFRYGHLASSRGQSLEAIDPAARLLSDESMFSIFPAASEVRQLRDRWSRGVSDRQRARGPSAPSA